MALKSANPKAEQSSAPNLRKAFSAPLVVEIPTPISSVAVQLTTALKQDLRDDPESHGKDGNHVIQFPNTFMSHLDRTKTSNVLQLSVRSQLRKNEKHAIPVLTVDTAHSFLFFIFRRIFKLGRLKSYAFARWLSPTHFPIPKLILAASIFFIISTLAWFGDILFGISREYMTICMAFATFMALYGFLTHHRDVSIALMHPPIILWNVFHSQNVSKKPQKKILDGPKYNRGI